MSTSHSSPATAPLFGVMAEFSDPGKLIEAADRTRQAGYKVMDAYSPFPIEGLYEAMGKKHTILPMLVLLGGLAGLCAGYGLEFWVNVIEYPLNIGGRPLNSIPSFIPIGYECTILFASLTAALGMLALNGFPQPYHPVFNVPEFVKCSNNGFFLCVESTDPQFDKSKVKAFLQSLGAQGVYEVES
jgi:hypothetical protein